MVLTSREKPVIAVVDDDESVCRAIKRLVRSLGLAADSFASSRDFLDLVEAMPSLDIDCIVLDVQMPGMNGLEVQDRLVKMHSPIPIIFITAHDDPGVREKALAAGAVAFIRKPFRDDLLVKTLGVAIERGRQGQGQK